MDKLIFKEISINEFDEVFEIMDKSFPDVEMRNYDDQKNLLERHDYKIKVSWNENNNIIAFIASWDLKNFKFVEHFAVEEKLRGQGIGHAMLKEYMDKCETPIVLEVEPPVNEIAVSRIKFYERLGFAFNDYEYSQPPLRKENPIIPLKIMSYPCAIDGNQFEYYKKSLYNVVYGLK